MLHVPVQNCVGECDPATPGCTKSSSLIDQRNPTCDVRTYNGGLSCCHHMYYLLDKDQEIPEVGGGFWLAFGPMSAVI